MSETAKQVAIELPRLPGVSIRSAAVSQTVAAASPGVCPACGCDSIFQQGHYQREFSEEMVSGESAGKNLSDSLEKNITAISCPRCQTRYVVESDEVFALREQQMELVMELSRKTLNVTEGSERVQ